MIFITVVLVGITFYNTSKTYQSYKQAKLDIERTQAYQRKLQEDMDYVYNVLMKGLESK